MTDLDLTRLDTAIAEKAEKLATLDEQCLALEAELAKLKLQRHERAEMLRGEERNY